DLRSVYGELEQRSAAQKRSPGRQVAAPRRVAELLVPRNVYVGPILPNGYAAAHLVCAADQRQPVARVQIAVVLQVVVRIAHDHLHGVGSTSGHQRRWFSVRVREVRKNDRTALGVTRVSPRREGGLERAAQLRLARPLRAPRIDRLLETQQNQVT